MAICDNLFGRSFGLVGPISQPVGRLVSPAEAVGQLVMQSVSSRSVCHERNKLYIYKVYVYLGSVVYVLRIPLILGIHKDS